MAHQSDLEARLAVAGLSFSKLEATPSIIYILQPDLQIIYCNEAWDQFACQNGGSRLVRAAIQGTSVLNAIPEPLRSFYKNAFEEVQKLHQPWEHDYECSSPEAYRVFHMRVLPLADSYLLVENSLRVERPHGPDRPVMPADDTLYVNEHGILTMCCHCRRTRRIGAAGSVIWDWVPAHLQTTSGSVSHGLCALCVAYFYPEVKRTP